MEPTEPIESPDIQSTEPVGGIEEPPEQLFYEVDNQKIPTSIEEVTKFLNSRDPELAELIKGDKKLTKLAVDLLGKDRRAEKKFHNAGLASKEAQEIAGLLQNPKSLFKHQSPQVRALYHEAAMEYLQEMAAQEEMTPEQRRIAELEERDRYYQEEDKKRQTEAQKRQYQQQLEAHVDRIIPEIDKAISDFGIETPYETAVGQIAWYIDRSIDTAQKYEDPSLVLTPAQAAQLYKEDLSKVTRPQIPKDNYEKILEFLGPEGKEVFRKGLLAEAQGKTSIPNAMHKPGAPLPTGQKSKPKNAAMSTDELRQHTSARLDAIFANRP